MIGDLFDSPWKILIIALVIIVLFGSRKLPSAARSLGQSMRILKTEVQGLHEDGPNSRPPRPLRLPRLNCSGRPRRCRMPRRRSRSSRRRSTTCSSRLWLPTGHGRGHRADSLTRGPQEMG